MYHDPGFKTIVQVAVVCRNIETTAKRWAAFLGVDVPPISTTDPGNDCGMTYLGKPSNARCKLAFFDTGTCKLELIQPLEGPSLHKEFLERHGEGLHHLAVDSPAENIDTILKDFNRKGIEVLMNGRVGKEIEYYYFDTEPLLKIVTESASGHSITVKPDWTYP